MAEIHVEEHSSPIKTPKQLVIVVLLAFLVPITLIVMLSQLVTSGGDFSKNNPGMSDEAIAKRMQPVGEVVVDPTLPKPEPVAPATVAAAALAVPAAAPSKGGNLSLADADVKAAVDYLVSRVK